MGFGYGYWGMMGGGFVFSLVYLVLVVYFFYLLSGINKSLQRIATTLENNKQDNSRN